MEAIQRLAHLTKMKGKRGREEAPAGMAENRKYPLSAEAALREGQVLTGPLFSEPMRVETVRSNGTDVWVAGLVGQQSEQFRRVTLTSDDISNLTIADAALSYEGDGRLLRIGLQAGTVKLRSRVRSGPLDNGARAHRVANILGSDRP